MSQYIQNVVNQAINYFRNVFTNVVQPEQIEIIEQIVPLIDQEELDMFPDEIDEPYEHEEEEEEEEEIEEEVFRSVKLEYSLCDEGISIYVEFKDWYTLHTDIFTFDYETTEEEMTEKIINFIDNYRRDCETEQEYCNQEGEYMEFEDSIREITSIDFLDEYCKNTVMKSSRNC